MCAVSNVLDYGRVNIPQTQWTRDTFSEYQEIIRRLSALDKKLNQPDCEDPAKATWMREVEDRLAKLEMPKVAAPRSYIPVYGLGSGSVSTVSTSLPVMD